MASPLDGEVAKSKILTEGRRDRTPVLSVKKANGDFDIPQVVSKINI